MRIRVAAISVACAGLFMASSPQLHAQTAPASRVQVVQADPDIVVRRRVVVRPPTRLRVYPRYYPRGFENEGVIPRYDPGPNAVRDCTAHYVQEFRPSGTVITPRMDCRWRPG